MMVDHGLSGSKKISVKSVQISTFTLEEGPMGVDNGRSSSKEVISGIQNTSLIKVSKFRISIFALDERSLAKERVF